MKNVPHNHLLNIRRMIIVAMRNVITKVMHCVINPSFTFCVIIFCVGINAKCNNANWNIKKNVESNIAQFLIIHCSDPYQCLP